jgi:hypothetical protein
MKIDRVETAGRRVERFAEVSLSVWEMRHSYESRMKAVTPISLNNILNLKASLKHGTNSRTMDNSNIRRNIH